MNKMVYCHHLKSIDLNFVLGIFFLLLQCSNHFLNFDFTVVRIFFVVGCFLFC